MKKSKEPPKKDILAEALKYAHADVQRRAKRRRPVKEPDSRT